MASARTKPKRAEKSRLARRFYTDALHEAEKPDFEEAMGVDGIDQEIAVLRLRLRTLIDKKPEDFALMLRGIDLLSKAVATRYKLSPAATEELSLALESTLKSLGPAVSGGAHDE